MIEVVVTRTGGKGWGFTRGMMVNRLAEVMRLIGLSGSLPLKQSDRDFLS